MIDKKTLHGISLADQQDSENQLSACQRTLAAQSLQYLTQISDTRLVLKHKGLLVSLRIYNEQVDKWAAKPGKLAW